MVSYDEFVTQEVDPFWGDGSTRESWKNLAERALSFALWLKDRPEEYMAMASHSAFLLTIFNAVFSSDSSETQTWFGTGEMRTVLVIYTKKEN